MPRYVCIFNINKNIDAKVPYTYSYHVTYRPYCGLAYQTDSWSPSPPPSIKIHPSHLIKAHTSIAMTRVNMSTDDSVFVQLEVLSLKYSSHGLSRPETTSADCVSRFRLCRSHTGCEVHGNKVITEDILFWVGGGSLSATLITWLHDYRGMW